MEKYKQLFKNVGFLTIGQFGSKILVLLLVPLYTSVLSTKDYGEYDLVYNTVHLLFPILSINISVSTQRFLLDSDGRENKIIKTSLKYGLIGIICFSLLMALNYIFNLNAIFKKNSIWLLLMYISLSFNTFLVDVSVGKDKLKILSISGFISTIILIVSNILFLIVFKLGLTGYFIANIIGPSLQSFIIGFKLKPFKNIFNEDDCNNVQREMLAYSKPQITNNIAWWVNNSSDRYIVTWISGLTANGIYSVAYKIPSIINVIQSIFGQAWGISAVKNFDDNDTEGFFSKIYEYYNLAMIYSCSFIILTTKIFASFMFAKEFYQAYTYVPALTIAAIFGALGGYLGGVFSAKKEGAIFARSTMIGAICNVLLNLILVYLVGPMGAAVATTVSYIVVWIIRLNHVMKMIKLHIEIKRHIVSYCILICQAITFLIIDNLIVMYVAQIAFIVVLIMLYKNMLIEIIRKITKTTKI